MATTSKSYPWESREARLEYERLTAMLVRAANVEAESIEWLWLDRIPMGRLTIVAGRPGQGKSLFSTFLAGEVTRAGGAVIISNPEDTRSDVQVPRLLAAEADTRLVHFWPGKCRIPEDVDELEMLVRFHGAKLIVLDPIRKHVGTKDAGQALEPLVAMAERTGVAIVGIHHLTKRASRTDHPMDALGGELGGFVGSARFAYALGGVPNGEPETRVMAAVKVNQGASDSSVEFYLDAEVEIDLPNGDVVQPARLVFVDNRCATDAMAVVTHNGGFSYKSDDPDKKAVAAEFLTLLLMHGPVTATGVFDKAAECGVSKATMRRAADGLEVVKKRIGFGPNSHLEWELPAGHPALAGLVPAMDEDGEGSLDGQMDVDEVIAAILDEAEGGGDGE